VRLNLLGPGGEGRDISRSRPEEEGNLLLRVTTEWKVEVVAIALAAALRCGRLRSAEIDDEGRVERVVGVLAYRAERFAVGDVTDIARGEVFEIVRGNRFSIQLVLVQAQGEAIGRTTVIRLKTFQNVSPTSSTLAVNNGWSAWSSADGESGGCRRG